MPAVSGWEGFTAAPIEYSSQQWQGSFSIAAVARLVVQVPEQDALITGEGCQDILDVALQPFPRAGIGIDHILARALHPAGVVDARLGAGCGPRLALRFQQSSKKTSIGRIPCRAAISRKQSMRCLKPSASASQSRSCKKVRTVLKPSDAAQPSSRSMATGSKISACHISSWLMALLG